MILLVDGPLHGQVVRELNADDAALIRIAGRVKQTPTSEWQEVVAVYMQVDGSSVFRCVSPLVS